VLATKIKTESITNKSIITKINQLAISINNLSNSLSSQFIKSKLINMDDNEISHLTQTDFEKFSNNMGLLSVLQYKENSLTHLLSSIEEYKMTYRKITGVDPHLFVNPNFDFYLNKQNQMFGFRFVLRDLNALNLQVQQLHTGLLQYCNK